MPSSKLNKMLVVVVTLLFVLAAGSIQALTLPLKKHKPLTTHNNASESAPPPPMRPPGRSAFNGIFYTELYLGTPPLKVNLAVDTASAITWVQSAHCTECFAVSLPNFDPNASSTFRPMPYNHPLCGGLYLSPAASFCKYEIDYVFRQVTMGDYAFETLAGPNKTFQIRNFAFGCGVFNVILLEGATEISGFLGLGIDDPSSFLLQLSSITLRKFSFCLPDNVGDEAPLRFGADAELSGPGVQTTPIIGNQSYCLNMTGISVNGSLLPINPGVFSSVGYGVWLDSGMDYSVFLPDAYWVFRRAVAAYLADEYLLEPLNQSRAGFDLCYNLTQIKGPLAGPLSGPSPPPVTFHFQGAEFELYQDTIFKAFDPVSEYCFMFMDSLGTTFVNLLGGYQMRHRRFYVDAAASIVSFAPEMC